jgi:hypothetical protein
VRALRLLVGALLAPWKQCTTRQRLCSSSSLVQAKLTPSDAFSLYQQLSVIHEGERCAAARLACAMCALAMVSTFSVTAW